MVPSDDSTTDQKEQKIVVAVPRLHKAIYPSLGLTEEQPWMEAVLSKEFGSGQDASAQSFDPGVKALPFDMRRAKALVVVNPHHAASMRAKKASTVGLGFVVEGDTDPEMEPAKKRKLRSKASKVLDSLCRVSLQDVLNDVCEEYWMVGNGYMEAVRPHGEPTAATTGLYHVPAPDINVVVEGDGHNTHFEEAGTGSTRKFARWGDLEDFRRRLEVPADQKVTELIHFPQSSSLNRWYGFPDWLAAISAMELAKALHQHTHDFYLNRAVPEFMLFFLGQKIEPKNWEAIENSLKSHIGAGNAHKSFALNLTDKEMKIQMEKLGIEGGSDSKEFSMLSDALALEVVTAHGVPPLLAGIQIPGKLGATNELPNALRAFQLLLVGPAQQTFTSILDCTLGDPKTNGGLGVSEGDFVLRAITDELDFDAMDTSSRMRQTEEDAKAEGRTASDGLKKALAELPEGKIHQLMKDAWADAEKGLIRRIMGEAA